MTDEEKARKLYKTKKIKQLIFYTFELDGNCSDLVVEVFKVAIRMGRKENSLKIKKLKKENAELKEQIEKMKMVASSWIMSLEDVRASEVNNRRFEVLRELEKRVENEK